jgi:integrase
MPVFKNEDNGTWYVMARYVNWKGERKQKCKRGFATKREAQEWERMFKLQTSSDLDMSFEAFTELYINDVKNRLKENTWLTKEHIIRTKILPYFGKLKISEISTKEIITWQNEMLAYRDEKKKPYSQTYLKTLHNQLSAIFNHAVRYYELRSNPAAKVGNMGREEHKEMLFWTKEEYKKFSFEMMDKPVSFYAFEMLYWCGIREGELLALTPADFNFDKETVTINKSYQRLKGQDVITSPKTKKSNRTIKMPKFLCEEMKEYLGMLYGLKKKDRFTFRCEIQIACLLCTEHLKQSLLQTWVIIFKGKIKHRCLTHLILPKRCACADMIGKLCHHKALSHFRGTYEKVSSPLEQTVDKWCLNLKHRIIQRCH